MVSIVIFLIAVVVGNQEKVFALEINLVSCTRRINTGGGDGVFASLLSISATLLLLFLLLSLFVKGITIIGSQKM